MFVFYKEFLFRIYEEIYIYYYYYIVKYLRMGKILEEKVYRLGNLKGIWGDVLGNREMLMKALKLRDEIDSLVNIVLDVLFLSFIRILVDIWCRKV